MDAGLNEDQPRQRSDAAPDDAVAPTELALLRNLALAAGKAAAAGAPLPGAMPPLLEAWLTGAWRHATPPEADQGFTQGYRAALDAAARHCAAAAETRATRRGESWNPLRRTRLRQTEAALRSMAAGLRLMAGGLPSHG